MQRWKYKKSIWASRPRINPDIHGVEEITEKQAKEFIQTHHYSSSYPAARCRAGLFRLIEGAPTLVGVAVFGVPANQKTIPCYAPGVAPNDGVELSRFVLLDEVEANGETWFLKRAFNVLKKTKDPSVVLSYSDPIPRTNCEGKTIKPGHYGCIYQAFNGRYVGKSHPRKLLLAPDGTTISGRALSKLRKEGVSSYCYSDLLSKGAPTIHKEESIDSYLLRVKKTFRTINHTGNYAYVWPLKRGVKTLPKLPYPKK